MGTKDLSYLCFVFYFVYSVCCAEVFNFYVAAIFYFCFYFLYLRDISGRMLLQKSEKLLPVHSSRIYMIQVSNVGP